LLIAGPAARALRTSVPDKIAAAVVQFINGPLVDNPDRVGKPLAPLLAPADSARRGTYRVRYLIDEHEKVIAVTAVRHRADAHRS
jgi:mRNA interferase RelE/StbE